MSDQPSPRTRARLLWVGVALTAAHLVILVARVPVLTKTPGWFWHFIDKPFASPVALGLGAAATVAALTALVWARGPAALRLLAVGLVGLGVQHGLAWSEGRGLDGLRDRVVATGHAEFAALAVAEPSVVDLITHYEARVEAGTLGQFAPSKPPGTLVFYLLTDRLAQWLDPAPDPGARLEHLRTCATWWWPFLAMATLVPLFTFTRRVFGDERTALVACALYVLVPSVQLITLHTDEVLFPLLAMVVAALTSRAFAQGRAGLALLAGAAAYLAMFCSFPLAAAAFVGASAGVGVAAPTWRCALGLAALVLAGAVVTDRGFAWAFGYDVVLRAQRAVAYHVAWRGWSGRPIEYVHYALLGLGEFALWLGVPVSLLALGSAARLRPLRSGPAALTAALGAVLVGLAVFGKTKGEVARLWLFLVPPACAVGAGTLARLLATSPRARLLTAAVFALEGAVLLATKRFQDFW